jgi:formate dehydrogenase major subunit
LHPDTDPRIVKPQNPYLQQSPLRLYLWKGGLMKVSRRSFLQLSALGAGAGALGLDLTPAFAAARQLKIQDAREFKTVCPYCAVGCGTIAYVHGSGGLNTVKSVIHVEGDPDNPINGGTLCPKGASQMQLAMSPRLQKSPLLRRAGSSEWEALDWDTAMDWLADKFKESRDRTFVTTDGQGRTVNRCDGIAWVGSATVANEDAYFITKLTRGLGLVYIDHQARI